MRQVCPDSRWESPPYCTDTSWNRGLRDSTYSPVTVCTLQNITLGPSSSDGGIAGPLLYQCPAPMGPWRSMPEASALLVSPVEWGVCPSSVRFARGPCELPNCFQMAAAFFPSIAASCGYRLSPQRARPLSSPGGTIATRSAWAAFRDC